MSRQNWLYPPGAGDGSVERPSSIVEIGGVTTGTDEQAAVISANAISKILISFVLLISATS